jgi:hypothetical protein
MRANNTVFITALLDLREVYCRSNRIARGLLRNKNRASKLGHYRRRALPRLGNDNLRLVV